LSATKINMWVHTAYTTNMWALWKILLACETDASSGFNFVKLVPEVVVPWHFGTNSWCFMNLTLWILSIFYTVVIYNFPFGLPVLEYVEGKIVCDNGLEEATARNYVRDIVSGLQYLHSHVRFKSFICFRYLVYWVNTVPCYTLQFRKPMVDKLRYILLKTIFQGANFFGKSFVFPLLQTPPSSFFLLYLYFHACGWTVFCRSCFSFIISISVHWKILVWFCNAWSFHDLCKINGFLQATAYWT